MPVIAHAERLTFVDASRAVIDDFTANAKRSLKSVRRRLNKTSGAVFGARRLVGITAADVSAYIAHRKVQGVQREKEVVGERRLIRVGDVSDAEINRELQVLKRVFSLTIKSGRIAIRPHIPMLREDNTRRGFFEPEQLAAGTIVRWVFGA